MGHRDVSSRLIAKIVLVATLTIAALYILYQVRNVVGLIVIAIFFALAVAPAVNYLSERRIPRPASIIVVYVAIASVIFGIGLLIVPPLVNGVEDLSNDFPGYIEDLRENETFRDYDDDYQITEKLQEQASNLPSKLGDAAGTLSDVTVGVFSSFVQLFAILVIAFFLLMEGHKMLEFFYSQVSGEREARLRTIADDISAAISGYVFGAFCLAFLAGLVTYATLRLLGVPFAVPLAILFAFFDLVPLVGATIGGILVGIVVAFFDFPGDLIIWVIVFVGYQQLENYIVQPVVYGRAVQVHPLVVLISILIGASLLGILGALIAIPAAATIQAVVRDYWRFYQESLMQAITGETPDDPDDPGTPPEPPQPPTTEPPTTELGPA